MKRLFLCFIACLFLSACKTTQTQYGPLIDQKSDGGYIDRQISQNHYEIQVRGNKNTTYDTLVSYFHRRAKELCGNKKYKSEVSKNENAHIKDAVLFGGPGYIGFIPEIHSKTPYVSGNIKC